MTDQSMFGSAPGAAQAAPAPLESIRDRVTQDWIADQASQRARQLAQTIAGKGARAPLAEAAKGLDAG